MKMEIRKLIEISISEEHYKNLEEIKSCFEHSEEFDIRANYMRKSIGDLPTQIIINLQNIPLKDLVNWGVEGFVGGAAALAGKDTYSLLKSGIKKIYQKFKDCSLTIVCGERWYQLSENGKIKLTHPFDKSSEFGEKTVDEFFTNFVLEKNNSKKSEWIEYNLGDLINIKHGYAFKGQDITSEETNNILVTPGNFRIGGGFKSEKFKYFKGDVPDSYILKDGDVVVTMTDLSKEGDTLGYSAKIPKAENKRFLHNQRIGLVEFLSDKVDQDFVYWLMRTREYQGFVVGAASGTSIKHTSPTSIKEYNFLLPPLEEQKAIAEVLSSLDDKIDLLHRQNQTLEKLAESHFRHIFIDNAQDDWEEGKLGDLTLISSGKGLSRDNFLENGLYPVLGANGIIGRTNEFLIDERVIYTGRVGTLGNIFTSNGKVWLSDNTLILRPKNYQYFFFVYFFMKNQNFLDHNVGSTQPLIRQSDIKNLDLTIPPQSRITEYSEICENFFDKIETNIEQIQNLEKLRDQLLPKLMSGEIIVRHGND